MALRTFLSKTLLPNFERDLSRSVASEMSTVPDMVDNLLAPQAHAFVPPPGAFQASSQRAAPVQMVQVAVPREGLFGDKTNSFH